MSRVRQPSEAFTAQIATRSMAQRQAAVAVTTASNTAAAMEAIDAPAIAATLADYETRLIALETP